MKVIVLIGVSGAGKSTYIKENFSVVDIHGVYSADHFFMKDGEYVFDPAKLPQAHKSCLRRFTEAVQKMQGKGYLIVDNTNTSVMEMAPYCALALAYGHELELVAIHCDPVAAARRNVHGVPEVAVMRQHSRMLHTLAKSENGGYANLPPWWPVTEVNQLAHAKKCSR